MGFHPQDQEVIRHLRKLKQVDNEYPPELLAARRQRFLRQMGEISLGIATGVSIGQALKTAKTFPTATITSKLLETVLVVAIIAEAGAVAYFYRDKLANVLKTFITSGEVQEIISPPIITTTQELPAVSTPSPGMTFTSTSVLPTVSENPVNIVATPTGTPDLLIVSDASPTVEAQATTAANSTPVPNGNNGNHYGQTPKPERTKENNGNDQRPPNDDHGPPRDDPGPPPRNDDHGPPRNDPGPPH